MRTFAHYHIRHAGIVSITFHNGTMRITCASHVPGLEQVTIDIDNPELRLDRTVSAYHEVPMEDTPVQASDQGR